MLFCCVLALNKNELIFRTQLVWNLFCVFGLSIVSFEFINLYYSGQRKKKYMIKLKSTILINDV